MQTAYVFLADGFEEIEAITPIDAMRRAGIQVETVGVTGELVTGAHGISVKADLDGRGPFFLPGNAALVVLPGGGAGTENLKNSPMVEQIVKDAAKRNLFIAAICAAPTVLHKYGLLQGKTVTAFPSVQGELTGSQVTGKAVEVDGKIITARSAGVALSFAHALITALTDKTTADETMANLYPGE